MLLIFSYVCIIMIYKLITRASFREMVRFKKIKIKDLAILAGFYVLMLGISEIITEIMKKLDLPTDFHMPSYFQNPLFIFVSAVIMAPFFEELFFRGFLLRVGEIFIGRYAIVIVAMVFAALHIQYPIPLLFIIFLSALFYGYFTTAYNSIFAGILGHFIQNLAGSIVIIYPKLVIPLAKLSLLFLVGLVLIWGVGMWLYFTKLIKPGLKNTISELEVSHGI